jgi:hypothetical protein
MKTIYVHDLASLVCEDVRICLATSSRASNAMVAQSRFGTIHQRTVRAWTGTSITLYVMPETRTHFRVQSLLTTLVLHGWQSFRYVNTIKLSLDHFFFQLWIVFTFLLVNSFLSSIYFNLKYFIIILISFSGD